MKPYIRNYRKHWGIGEQDAPLCEWCEARRMTDLPHHTIIKGMGGRKDVDDVEYLLGLCLECHDEAHSNPALNARMKALAADMEEREKRWKLRERIGS